MHDFPFGVKSVRFLNVYYVEYPYRNSLYRHIIVFLGAEKLGEIQKGTLSLVANVSGNTGLLKIPCLSTKLPYELRGVTRKGMLKIFNWSHYELAILKT